MDFGLLVFQQADQLVVLLDGLQWLNEYCLAAGGGSVRHALDTTPLFDLDGNDKSLAANGDELVLHSTALGQPSQIRP